MQNLAKISCSNPSGVRRPGDLVERPERQLHIGRHELLGQRAAARLELRERVLDMRQRRGQQHAVALIRDEHVVGRHVRVRAARA